MMHAIKFFGQFGFPLQPSFSDPIYMQYHQQPFVEGYGVSAHLLAPRASVGGQIGPFDSQKRPNSGAYLDDKKLHNQKTGANLNSNRDGLIHPGYFGHPSNLGFVPQYPSSPLCRPVLSGYPESSPGLLGGRNEMKRSPASGRNGGLLSGWQGQRAFDSAHDPKIAIFLEELKSGKGRRFELSDIIGHIVEFRQVLFSVVFLPITLSIPWLWKLSSFFLLTPALISMGAVLYSRSWKAVALKRRN